MRTIPGAYCCFDGCSNPATWEVVTGLSPLDDYTHSCDDHAGHLAHHAATAPLPGGEARLEPISAASPPATAKGGETP